MSKVKIKRDAPNVTLKQFIDAKCEPRRKKGPFITSAYRLVPDRAETHDSAYNKLSKKYPTFRAALSEISPAFWGNNWAGGFFARIRAILLLCSRGVTNGADNTCWTGEKTTGQINLIEKVATGNDKSKLRYMEAFFTITGNDPVTLFEQREIQIARGSEGLRNELIALAGKTNAAEVENIVKGVEGKTLSMRDRGVSTTAAMQLAAAAFLNVYKLVNSGTDCNSDAVKQLYAKGNLWLKIARRLAHGSDAVRWQKSQSTQSPLDDPLFMQRGGLSAFMCMANDKKTAGTITNALKLANVQGVFGEISPTTTVFLVGAMAMADSVMANCNSEECKSPKKWFTRNGMRVCEKPNKCTPPRKRNETTNVCEKQPDGQPDCSKERIRGKVYNERTGKCECPPDKPLIVKRRMRCEKKVTCTDGKVWRRLYNDCKCPPEKPLWVVPHKKCEKRETCGSGYRYRRYYNDCKERGMPPPPVCRGGQILKRGKCVCPNGLKWIKNKCQKPAVDPFGTMKPM